MKIYSKVYLNIKKIFYKSISAKIVQNMDKQTLCNIYIYVQNTGMGCIGTSNSIARGNAQSAGKITKTTLMCDNHKY